MIKKKNNFIIMINNFQMRVLFFRDGRSWVAQGLEFDIVAQGKTIKEAQESFERVLVTNVVVNIKNGIEPLSQFKPAPEMFHMKHFGMKEYNEL